MILTLERTGVGGRAVRSSREFPELPLLNVLLLSSLLVLLSPGVSKNHNDAPFLLWAASSSTTELEGVHSAVLLLAVPGPLGKIYVSILFVTLNTDE